MYKYSVERVHLPKMRKHNCSTCGETDPSKFYGHKKSICGKCHNKYTLDLGRQRRKFLLENLGGKCVACGYDKYEAAMQCHHLDPTKKDKAFSSMRGWSEQRILDEIKDCVLLCACCHAAVHNNELELRDVAQR